MNHQQKALLNFLDYQVSGAEINLAIFIWKFFHLFETFDWDFYASNQAPSYEEIRVQI